MYRLEIKRMISLHACAQGWQADHCNPDFLNMENKLWDALSLLDSTPRVDGYNPNYVFEDVPIYDMHSGPINSWIRLNQVPFNDANNRTMIHCAGGFGRTCSALLMLSWKRKYQRYPGLAPPQNWPDYADPVNLSTNFIGLGNSRGLYDGLLRHFNGRIHVFTDQINGQFQNTINLMGNMYPVEGNPTSRIESMRDEVFDLRNDTYANLFIQRVNRMIICWASDHLQALIPADSPPGTFPSICLFPCYTVDNALRHYTPDNIFQDGLRIYMIDINSIQLEATTNPQLQLFFGPPLTATGRPNI
jgi:hypothetical protein